MASIHQKGEAWHCQFVYHGKRHTFSLGKVVQDEAETKANQVDYLLMRLKQNLLQLPPGMDIVTFISVRWQATPGNCRSRDVLTLGHCETGTWKPIGTGAWNNPPWTGSNCTSGTSSARSGRSFPIPDLSLADLQQHVDRRGKKKGLQGEALPGHDPQGNRHAPDGMELGRPHGASSREDFRTRGLRYPRFTEKPPFMVWEEIERRIKGLDGGRGAGMVGLPVPPGRMKSPTSWTHVKEKAVQPWVYPLVLRRGLHGGQAGGNAADARHGRGLRRTTRSSFARRSASKGKTTTRRVPLTPVPGRRSQGMAGGSSRWPRSSSARPPSCGARRNGRPPSRSPTMRPTTISGGSVKDSKWKVLRGYHVFRHSFISACASKGIDQRLIDEWTGHATDEQRKRYRHLYPVNAAGGDRLRLRVVVLRADTAEVPRGRSPTNRTSPFRSSAFLALMLPCRHHSRTRELRLADDLGKFLGRVPFLHRPLVEDRS